MELKFRKFHQKFPYLDIQESIEYFSIFDGYPLSDKLNLSYDLKTVIKKEIIDKVDMLKEYFIYDKIEEDQKLIEKILIRLSKGDRKNYSVYDKENLPQGKGRELFGHLYSLDVIKKEKSREEPFKKTKKQPIKKSLRRYKVQDKIHISNNFTRFWFTFILPLLNKNEEITFSSIEPYIEKYISLEFEKLSISLIIEKYKNEEILNSGSYWGKNIEIDLYIETKKRKIAGEAKWKNSKICKNILNSLQKKCIRANLPIDTFVLFSKSSFSKELKSKKYDNTQIYELSDFEVLYK